MELRIREPNNFADRLFGLWLVSKIRTHLISNMKNYHFDQWNNYINKSEDIRKLQAKHLSVEQIIIFASDNITCTCVPGELVISFNLKKFVPTFDRLSLNTIIKTINYGTLDIKGCPIFTDTLKEFEKNIDNLLSSYYLI